MGLDSDFELTLTNNVKVTDHSASLRPVCEAEIDEGVVVSLVGFLNIYERVLADCSLMEDILIADVLDALEHASHPLQVVLGQIGEE